MSVLVPSSRLGKWSVGLILAAVVLAVVGSEISTSISNGLDYLDPITSPLLATVIYLMVGVMIAASACGLVAVLEAPRSLTTALPVDHSRNSRGGRSDRLFGVEPGAFRELNGSHPARSHLRAIDRRADLILRRPFDRTIN